MKILRGLWRNRKKLGLVTLGLGLIAMLMFYKLGSLVGGLSSGEKHTASLPVGWQGIYHNAFWLPLKLIQSLVFGLVPSHGQTLSRLPSILLGACAIIAFFLLLKLWHGWRTALLAGLLFATSAWTLHISRLVAYDVVDLSLLPILLLANVCLHRWPANKWLGFGYLVLCGLLLYVPGGIWLVALNSYWQWEDLVVGWKAMAGWFHRSLYIFTGLVWLPLLGIQLTRPGALKTWLGLPAHLPGIVTWLQQLGKVPLHLFVYGPADPTRWLGRMPILDIFSLVLCLMGAYFYIRHWRAFRSRLLGSYFLLGILLASLGGGVSLSLLVPLLYLVAATGVAYLLHEWLTVFPINPLARTLGIGLVALAIGLSCLYNLRAYFIAWPHHPGTTQSFRYHR
ncbi:MAG TPA: hypothetical protein VG604_02740 [Candidatus Saccharimonadales bacterium]|nr:hypothetical protein [Candidatus Saccharimonadales bacterium]